MGEVTVYENELLIVIRSIIHFYGEAADQNLAEIVVNDISAQWNGPDPMIYFDRQSFNVRFEIDGKYNPGLAPEEVIENIYPENNYFRVENFATGNISFVDEIGSNTGYFLKVNLLNHSTTAAHEYGHSLGLKHPTVLDIRGKGEPGIMFPRGTIVDPEYQYDPQAKPGEKGGTLNPFLRKVQLSDIDDLQIQKLDFENGKAIIGDFSSVWHEAQTKQPEK